MDVTPMLDRLSAYDAFRWAVDLFEERDYYAAAEVLQHLVDSHPHESELRAARELLVRSYYHSAQLARASDAARTLLQHDPANDYAALLLARSLERTSRHAEADAVRRLADALGAGS